MSKCIQGYNARSVNLLKVKRASPALATLKELPKKVYNIKLNTELLILFLMSFIYIVIACSVAVSMHNSFLTNTWDLGIYAQALYTTINHGKIFYYTAELPGNPSGSIFGIHFSPILFLILPIYAIRQDPTTLLFLKPIIISAGLFPLYYYMRNQQIRSKAAIITFSILYLAYMPMNATLINFDVEVFLQPLFLSAMYYLAKGKLISAYIFILFALMVNEFVPIITIFIALYVILRNKSEIVYCLKSRKITRNIIFPLILIATSVAWFMLASALITYFNPTALTTKWEWGEFGKSPFEIIQNIMCNPIKAVKRLLDDGQRKFIYLVSLFGPLAFLSLFDPLTLTMTLPWFAASFLSIDPLYYSIRTQYPAFVSPFIFIAAINGFSKLTGGNMKNGKKIVLPLIAFTMLTALLLSSVFPTSNVNSGDVRLVLEKIPNNASASVMPEVLPHLCNRLEVYPYFKNGTEYILVNVYSWWYSTTLPKPAHLAEKWCDVEIPKDYGILVNTRGVILYKKGYNGQPLIFSGIEFTYTTSNVTIISGKLSSDILIFEGNGSAEPLFTFQNSFPPGTYNVTLTMNSSSTEPSDILTLNAFKQPQNDLILSKKIRGNEFSEADTWEKFTFTFDVKQPSIIKIVAVASGNATINFYSLNILQVSGSTQNP